jgi:hypothetical protein
MEELSRNDYWYVVCLDDKQKLNLKVLVENLSLAM